MVVGGHAVNLWALHFLKEGVSELEELQPFTSKDLDVIGTTKHLEALHLKLKGKIWRSEPRSPVIGRLELPFGEGVRIVEVLHTVKGLHFGEIEKNVDLEWEGLTARVVLPHLMLKAKIANSVEIDQSERNDVRHVRAMIHCTRAFVLGLLAMIEDGTVTQREAVNLLEEIREVIGSDLARRAVALWGFDFSRVWPAELMVTKLEKLTRFVEHRLQRPAN